jgi:4-diphosphocytidyl-2-C-methyl-D-erythritol kinase
MIYFPNAKINLGLHVTAKRQDGYHNIETVFYPVGLSDILEIVAEPKGLKQNKIINTGNNLNIDPSENLCLRAWNELNKIMPLPGVEVHLHKIIPSGAGLGGGSSNAAFVLKALNELFALNLSKPELSSIAGRIGSDCPFFIHGTPLYARERGDVFEPAGVDLSGKTILIAHPGINISTAWAYSKIKPARHRVSLKDSVIRDPSCWQDNLINDFEPPVFNAFPVIRIIKEKIIASGAFFASMTGSGSAVYGLYDTKLKRVP